MGHGSDAVFQIGPLGVTSPMITMVAITLLLTLLSIVGTRKMRTVPKGLQNVCEMAVEMLSNFFKDLLGPDLTRKYFSLLATLFLFILFSNYSGILPFAGRVPGFAPPTATLSVTVTLALMVFVVTHFAGLRENGLGYGKHFIKPFVFLFPLLILEELVKPVSLSLRLYGNVFGEESVTHQLFEMVPIALPVVMNVFSLLMGFIQAMVFVLLASIYIGTAAGEGH